ncbi:hypothetical protein, partial [Parabacteroides johnsonii]
CRFASKIPLNPIGCGFEEKQKQGIKSYRTKQINSSTSPFRFRKDPDIHISHTRVSHLPTPESKEVFQVAFRKKVAYLGIKDGQF